MSESPHLPGKSAVGACGWRSGRHRRCSGAATCREATTVVDRSLDAVRSAAADLPGRACGVELDVPAAGSIAAMTVGVIDRDPRRSVASPEGGPVLGTVPLLDTGYVLGQTLNVNGGNVVCCVRSRRPWRTQPRNKLNPVNLHKPDKLAQLPVDRDQRV